MSEWCAAEGVRTNTAGYILTGLDLLDDSGRRPAAWPLDRDPFISLDPDGVGELVKIAAERGRKTRPDIKLGICGEHGGDPASIHFCASVGLNYVSCSPYRVPIAKLAAAQAALTGDQSGRKGEG